MTDEGNPQPGSVDRKERKKRANERRGPYSPATNRILSSLCSEAKKETIVVMMSKNVTLTYRPHFLWSCCLYYHALASRLWVMYNTLDRVLACKKLQPSLLLAIWNGSRRMMCVFWNINPPVASRTASSSLREALSATMEQILIFDLTTYFLHFSLILNLAPRHAGDA